MLSDTIGFPDFLFSLVSYDDVLVRDTIALVVFVVIIAVVLPLRAVIVGRISGYAPVNRDIARIVASILSPLSFIILLVPIPLLIAVIPPVVGRFIWIVVFLFVVFEASRILTGLIEYSFSRIAPKLSRRTEPTRFSIIFFLVRATLFSIAALFALTNLGIDVGPLMASFGVAGIVIGFGMQNILSDVFATLVIELDRPFEMGDIITIGADTGRVERVNFRSTRIRSITGETIIVPNRDIAASRIRNSLWAKHHTFVYTIPVEGTSVERVEKLAHDLTGVLTADKKSSIILKTIRLHAVRDSAYEYEIVVGESSDIVSVREHIVSEVARVCERDAIPLRAVV